MNNYDVLWFSSIFLQKKDSLFENYFHNIYRWSYGVLIFEVITLGGSPYAGWETTEVFVANYSKQAQILAIKRKTSKKNTQEKHRAFLSKIFRFCLVSKLVIAWAGRITAPMWCEEHITSISFSNQWTSQLFRFELMNDCWCGEPQLRPTFTELRQRIAKMMEDVWFHLFSIFEDLISVTKWLLFAIRRSTRLLFGSQE